MELFLSWDKQRDGTLARRRRGALSNPSEFDRTLGNRHSWPSFFEPTWLGTGPGIVSASYSPSSIERFHHMLSKLDIQHDRYTFIDCGSGNCLVLLLASQYSFKQIIGVEFSRPLHQIAENNLGRDFRELQRCANTRSVCRDATRYTFPPEPSVAYFYNPFSEGRIFEKVLRNLLSSHTECPRDLIVIYLNPVFVECLDASKGFEKIHEVTFGNQEEDKAVIYRVPALPCARAS